MRVKKFIKNCLTMYYVRDVIFVSPCKRALIKLCVYSCFIVLTFFIYSMVQVLFNQKCKFDNMNDIYPKTLKQILFWNQVKQSVKVKRLQTQGPTITEGQSIFIRQGCRYINCVITYDKQLLRKHNNLDAIVFGMKDITDLSPKHFEITRSSNHLFIFHSLQSSEGNPICDPLFDGFFNWTWTYRLDSDIPQPFISIYDSDNKLVGPIKGMNWTSKMAHNTRFLRKFTNKTKAVAWIVNNCNTKLKYQDFVRDLEKEIKGYNYTLDTYGTCGNMRCPDLNVINCYKMIERKYFFQLVIEDTFAEDYVSEKVVHAMNRIVIPIILGPSDYKNFLPPGSFINGHIFDVKKLGAIIDYLIGNPITYRYFFDWKNYYYYTARPRFQVCELCEKLNTYNISDKPIIKSNFRKWWNPSYKNACLQKRFDKILN